MSNRRLIASPSNPIVKRIKKLRSRKHRDKESSFFADGIHVVAQAIEHDAEIETLIVAPELLTSAFARDVVSDAEKHGTPTIYVSADIYAGLVDRDNPVGLGALVRTRISDIDSLELGDRGLVLAAEDVGNPGNLGTIIRTADATGASGVVLAGSGTDPFHPNAVKATMGSIFSVPVCRVETFDAAIGWGREKGASIVTTSAHATLAYTDADFSLPAMVAFGSEATGLSADVRAQADLDVAIPMRGSVTSLNLAVAVGIITYEVIRRGRARTAS